MGHRETNLIGAFLFQSVANFSSLVLGLALPNWMTESSLAEYLLASTALQTAMLVALLGTKQSVERSYGAWKRNGDRAAGAFLASMAVGRLAATLLSLSCLLGLAWSFRRAGLSKDLLPWLLALVAVRSVGEWPFHVRLSVGERTAGAWPQSVRFLLRIPAVLGGYAFGGLRGAFGACLAVEIGLAAVGWWRARRDLKWNWQGLAPGELRAEWKFTSEVAAYSILVIALNGLGPWVAAWLRAPASKIVDFTMAWQLSLQFLQLLCVAQQAAIPVLVKALEQGDRSSFHDGVDTQARLTWMIVSTATGAAALVAAPLVDWAYGPARAGLAPALVGSLAAAGAWAMLSVFLHALFAAGKARPTVVLHGAMLAAAALLFAGFAPWLGTPALPALYLAVCLAGWAGAARYYRRVLGDPLVYPTAARLLLSAGYGLVAYAAAHFLPPVAGLAVFLLIHGVGLLVSGVYRSARAPELAEA